MRGASCVVVLACACSSHSGAYITVGVTDPQVDTVALYIGDATCSIPQNGSSVTCSAITPDTESQPLRLGQNGGAYFRDTNVTFTSKVSGGKAEFHLEEKQTDTVEIVAVGFTKDTAAKNAVAVSVMDNVEIPANDVVKIQTDLDPASPVLKNEDPKLAQPDGNYVLVWASPNAPGDCVLAEQWTSGKARRTYVLPEEDADCDGLPTLDAGGKRNPLECDPLWFARPTPVGSGQTDCATFGTITTNTTTTANVCLVGGPACVDGVGVSPGVCSPLAQVDYCMPQVVCGHGCAAPPNGGPLGPCFDSFVANATPLTYYQCTIYADSTGAPCPNAGTSATLDFGALFGGSMKTCSSVGWAPDSVANFMPSDTLAFPGTPAQFNTSTSNNPCTVQIEWNGGALMPFDQQWLLADLTVTSTQHLVVPVLFNHDLCPPPGTDGITCMQMWQQGTEIDTMLSCAK